MDDPQLNRPKGANRDIRQLLEAPRTQSLMKALATRHLGPDRLTRLAVIACQKTPQLLKCEPLTLLGAFLGCSALGLEPNTPLQHLHLIPFGNSVQVIIGYRGYLELGRRSGLITGMHADVVYPADEFEYLYGTETYLRHKPKDWNGPDTEYTHAYCFVQLKDGQAFVVMPKTAIHRIRDQSQGYRSGKKDSPWFKYEPRMARKSPVRQLFGGGEVPLSLEMANAVSIDEGKVDFSALTHASAEQIKDGMADFVEHDGDPQDNGNGNSPQIEDQGEEMEEQRPAVGAEDEDRRLPDPAPVEREAKAMKAPRGRPVDDGPPPGDFANAFRR